MKYQTERDVSVSNLSNVCNRIVAQGGKIIQVLPYIAITTTYVILYVI